MMRSPVKKGPWTPEEDEKLREYINKNGFGNWRSLPKLAGLNRCGKSCRLRWMNYLRPDIRRGNFSDEEETLILKLHALIGNKWSKIASHLPGRTDNEIKNYWNTHMRKKLLQKGIDPNTHMPRTDLNHFLSVSQLLAAANNTLFNNNAFEDLLKVHLLHNILQIMNPNTLPNITPFNTNSNSAATEQKSAEGPFNAVYPNLFGSNPQTNVDFLSSLGNLCGTKLNTSEPVGTSGSWNSLEENRLPALVSVSQENSNTKPVTTDHQTGTGMEPGFCGYDQYQEARVPVSVSPDTPGLNQTETAQLSSGSDSLEAWEKLLDDDAIDSCWKYFLDLTSPKSSSVDVAW